MENQIHLLQEQIRSAKQNEALYQEQSQSLLADQQRREKEEEKYLEEKEKLEQQFLKFQAEQAEAQRAFKNLAMEIHSLEEKVEGGKNEIIEILNLQGVYQRKITTL